MGDPAGYCLAWCYWYMELRLKNLDIKPKDLIIKAYDHINKSASKNRDSEFIFIDHIRNYASILDKNKNKFLLKSGVKKDDIYNMVPRIEDENKISDYISIYFLKLINNRI